MQLMFTRDIKEIIMEFLYLAEFLKESKAVFETMYSLTSPSEIMYISIVGNGNEKISQINSSK